MQFEINFRIQLIFIYIYVGLCDNALKMYIMINERALVKIIFIFVNLKIFAEKSANFKTSAM